MVSFAPELASRDEIFPHICAVWSSICNVLFRQCPFTQEISETAYFLYRLLVSVDIGLVCSWVGVAGWDFPHYLRGLVINLKLLFFQGSSLQEISETVYFFYRLLVTVDIGLVCSWVGVAGWDFPPYLRGLVISLQRFFFQCSFLQETSKTAYFLYRLLVSVNIGLVCSWLGVAGWDFPPYLRGLVINLQRFFGQCPFTQEISETVYFLYRYLVTVDIGLVCSWVGVAGWDFPPYLRGLVINLQRFVSTMPVYAGDITKQYMFCIDC